MTINLNDKLDEWRKNPAAFITQALINPEKGKRFVLFEAELTFLRHAFTPDAAGDLPYKDILWSCIKKSGKSTFGALCMLFTVLCLGGRRFAEAYVIANDYDQSQSRIFTSAARIVEASPSIRAKITADRITFSNGSFIQALAADYRGAAGVEPCFVIADELWGFTSESSQRLYEECCPTPTRKPSVRMVTTYAGFTGESVLLEGLVKRGKAGQEVAKDLYVQPGMVAFISHERIAPWQSEAWMEEARQSTRPSAFLRQYHNEFTSGESSFVPIEWFDACVDEKLSPVLQDKALQIFVGVDASVVRDSTAIVACAWDATAKKVKLVNHRIYQPSKADPLEFESTVESRLIELSQRFSVRSILYDPWQMAAVSQRLTALGLPMEPYPQSVPNLTASSTNLFEVIKSKSLAVYPDADIRLAISHAVAVESARGWRITKISAGHKIDVVVALAQAALGAVQGQGSAITCGPYQAAPRDKGRFFRSTAGTDGRDTAENAEAAEDAQAITVRGRSGRWGLL